MIRGNNIVCERRITYRNLQSACGERPMPRLHADVLLRRTDEELSVIYLWRLRWEWKPIWDGGQNASSDACNTVRL